MNKMAIVGGIVLTLIVISMAYGASMNPGGNEEKRADSEIWNFRFSGPEFHDINSHQFSNIPLEQNVPYKFEFVPMGDSPERVRVTIGGGEHGIQIFSEEFILKRELVDTGISKYYTWDYSGDKYFEVSNQQCKNQNVCNYDLNVQRFGNLKGSVSISLIAIDRSI
tara:strand:+ start:67 stop:564 length:498 start_codon:yes stop_codon:yes gene_type:complete